MSPKYHVNNCLKYYHDDNFGIKCYECKTGYKHTTDDKFCVDEVIVKNCKSNIAIIIIWLLLGLTGRLEVHAQLGQHHLLLRHLCQFILLEG